MYLKRLIFKFRLNRAINLANKKAKQTFYRYYVILWKGKPLVVRKKNIKLWIRTKKLNTTIKQIEAKALYVTPIKL